MQIQLKQTEIVSALKMYVAAQGFNLAGKTVDIAFTAGRGQTGLSADINIEDAEIPGVEEGVEHPKPTLAVVNTISPAPAPSPAAPPDPQPVADKAEDAAPAVKPSLFGN